MRADPATPNPGASDRAEVRSTRVLVRPIANPLVLGFTGLAAATILVSGIELGWISASDRVQTAVLVLAFVPTIQLVGCVFGFLARDAVAATALGVQAGTWLCVGLSLLLAKSSSHGHSHELALLLFVSGTAMLASAAIALQSKVLPALVLALAGVRYVLTGIYKLGAGGVAWQHAAGWLGVALCAAALYAMLSLELEEVLHRPVLPTLRRSKGKRAATLDEQVEGVAAEAGVRSQL